MPLPALDSAVAYTFMVKIDGVALPSVVSVSEISTEFETIDYKQQTADGKYVNRRLAGRTNGGEFTISRGMDSDKALSSWLTQVMNGDMTGARKTAEVTVLDLTGASIKTYTFFNCWIKSLKTGSLEAGGSSVLTEDFTVSFDTMTMA